MQIFIGKFCEVSAFSGRGHIHLPNRPPWPANETYCLSEVRTEGTFGKHSDLASSSNRKDTV